MTNSKEWTRRAFGRAAAAALAGPAIGVLGANEKINLGVIGCGNRGQYDLGIFLRSADVRVAALCDVDPSRIETTLARHFAGDAPKPLTTGDFRKVLENPGIDAVLIATPDHWHAFPFVLACQAGKDVYSEKPLAHNIYEGQKMVEAAHGRGRVTQIGTQQRSNPHFFEAVQRIRNGALGKVVNVECWNVDRRMEKNMGSPPDSNPPAGVDYDLWLGPAPKRAFNPNRFHGTFRWFWDYAGGQITDWGTHLLDIVQWALGQEAPLTVTASGGKYAMPDNRETPDTFDALFEYAENVSVHYFNRMCSTPNFYGRGYGIVFYGTDATLFIDRSGYELTPLTPKARKQSAQGRDITDGHVQEFLANIKTRKRCVSDVAVAHRSTTASHLANIALRSGEKLHWDGRQEKIVNHPELNRLLKRESREPWGL